MTDTDKKNNTEITQEIIPELSEETKHDLRIIGEIIGDGLRERRSKAVNFGELSGYELIVALTIAGLTDQMKAALRRSRIGHSG